MDARRRNSYSEILRRIQAIEGKLESPPDPYRGRLPHVVFQATEAVNDLELWKRYLDGEMSVIDWPGREAHNKENIRLAARLGVLAKVYLFDPDSDEWPEEWPGND